jgi:hypothetical protein
VTTYCCAADELVAPRLLLGSGVAPDQEHAHQPDQHGAERTRLPEDLATDGVERPCRTGHRNEGGVVVGHRGGPVELSLGRVEAHDADRLRPVEGDDAQAPPQEHPSVSAHVVPQQDEPAGHRDTSSVTSTPTSSP